MRKKKLINQLKDDICDLENEIEELRAQISYLKMENQSKRELNLAELLKDYQYAILVKGYDTKVWNDGRFEKGVREISFEHIETEIPELTIRR